MCSLDPSQSRLAERDTILYTLQTQGERHDQNTFAERNAKLIFRYRRPSGTALGTDRVWPYRILYRRIGSKWLDVLSIEHRKDVYR